MDNPASSLLPALLEKSLTVTVLAILLGAALWAIYKLWQRANTRETAHAAALADINAQRLKESQEYALAREENSKHLRTMVDKFGQVLNSIETRSKDDEKTRHLIGEIAANMGIPLQKFI